MSITALANEFAKGGTAAYQMFEGQISVKDFTDQFKKKWKIITNGDSIQGKLRKFHDKK